MPFWSLIFYIDESRDLFIPRCNSWPTNAILLWLWHCCSPSLDSLINMIIHATLVLPVAVQITRCQWHVLSVESLLERVLGDGLFRSTSALGLFVVVPFCRALGLSQQHIAPVQSRHRRLPSMLARMHGGQVNLVSVRDSLSIQATTVWPKRTISPCFKYQAHSPWRIPMWRRFACHPWAHQHWLPVNGHPLVTMWVMQPRHALQVEENARFWLFRWRLSDGVHCVSRAPYQHICNKWLFRPSITVILPALPCWAIVWTSSVLVSPVVEKVSFYPSTVMGSWSSTVIVFV